MEEGTAVEFFMKTSQRREAEWDRGNYVFLLSLFRFFGDSVLKGFYLNVSNCITSCWASLRSAPTYDSEKNNEVGFALLLLYKKTEKRFACRNSIIGKSR